MIRLSMERAITAIYFISGFCAFFAYAVIHNNGVCYLEALLFTIPFLALIYISDYLGWRDLFLAVSKKTAFSLNLLLVDIILLVLINLWPFDQSPYYMAASLDTTFFVFLLIFAHFWEGILLAAAEKETGHRNLSISSIVFPYSSILLCFITKRYVVFRKEYAFSVFVLLFGLFFINIIRKNSLKYSIYSTVNLGIACFAAEVLRKTFDHRPEILTSIFLWAKEVMITSLYTWEHFVRIIPSLRPVNPSRLPLNESVLRYSEESINPIMITSVMSGFIPGGILTVIYIIFLSASVLLTMMALKKYRLKRSLESSFHLIIFFWILICNVYQFFSVVVMLQHGRSTIQFFISLCLPLIYLIYTKKPAGRRFEKKTTAIL